MASSLRRSSSSSKPQRPRSISNLSASSNSATNANEIATFAARLASSFDDDEDNHSIISLHEEEFFDDRIEQHNTDEDERRGLVVDYKDLRGCGTASTGASSSCLEDYNHRAEDCDGIAGEESSSLLVSSSADAAYNNHDEDGDNSIRMMRHSQRCQLVISRARNNPSLSIIAAIFVGICTIIYLLTSDQFHNITILRTTTEYIRSRTHQLGIKIRGTNHNSTVIQPHLRPLDKTLRYPPFPAKELLGITINNNNSEDVQDTSSISIHPPYNPSDFYYQNKDGKNRTLTYWEEVVAAIEEFQEKNDRLLQNNKSSIDSNTPWANITAWGPCFPRALSTTNDKHSRSLLKKKTKPKQLISNNWTYIIQNSNNIDTNDEKSIQYPTYMRSYLKVKEEYLGGLCRPGFLIIGQGKCGTSSLYKYLTGHDRVLPAVQKQIHYFIFNVKKSLKWYYSNFPTIESFLGTGTLMTGEASPGYMPYPSVIELLVRRMSPTEPNKLGANNGLEAYADNIQSLPKIISIVRDPIERAVSSYKYNYIVPALAILKRGRGRSASGKQIPGGRTEQFYKDNHLYSFEELASAELVALKECLQAGGRGETYSYDRYGKFDNMFFHGTFLSRANSSKTPLIDLDGACYEETESPTIPRVQWNELALRSPDKILDLPNLQLTQSIVGRGVYVLPLEWWYEVFASASEHGEDWIHTVCTEEMGDEPVESMNDVASFLGLPKFDFTAATRLGRYNVGGHRGYDTVTAVDEESDEPNQPSPSSLPDNKTSPIDLTSISDELMTELKEFYRPYNERLFELIGKRCDWKE